MTTVIRKEDVLENDDPGTPIVLRCTDNRSIDRRIDGTIIHRYITDDGEHVGYLYRNEKGGHITQWLNEVVPDGFESMLRRILSGFYTDPDRLHCHPRFIKRRGAAIFRFDMLNCYYRPGKAGAFNEALFDRLWKEHKGDFEEVLGAFVKECK